MQGYAMKLCSRLLSDNQNVIAPAGGMSVLVATALAHTTMLCKD